MADNNVYHHHGDNEPDHGRHPGGSVSEETAKAYWRANVRLMLGLLAIWAIVPFGLGIVFADALNKITFLGFPFGFWWAQQGSIFVFLILIFVYVFWMHRIDRRFGVDDDPEEPG